MGDVSRADPPGPRVAEVIADLLVARRIERIYGLTGGHTKPLWDALSRRGVQIVHVRHEAAAVHMAHAAAELTGRVAVATVTCGPGVTNAVTGVAVAEAAGAPVLLLGGLPPRPQLGRGAFEELAQTDLLRPITRFVSTLRDADQVWSVLDEAWHRALGWGSGPGPAFVDIPVDVLRSPVSGIPAPGDLRRVPTPPGVDPVPSAVAGAAALLRDAQRPVVVSGRGVRGAEPRLLDLLDATGAFHLETRDTRGIVRPDHPAAAPAARRRLMAEADTIVTVGRRLDYELAYGSPAVFSRATRFVRVGTTYEELEENRAADLAVVGDVRRCLDALVAADPAPASLDHAWVADVRAHDDARRASFADRAAGLARGTDGRMHPLRLVAAINAVTDEDDVVVADGGDILSFAAVGLAARRLLHPGSFGCLGVGVPFGIGAAMSCPDKRVVVLSGDGAFGFNALELHTAAQYDVPVVVVVANNEAWNIERHDRIRNFGNDLFSTELPGTRYHLIAEGLGVRAERVEDPESLEPALRRALADPPALVEVMISGQPLSPDFQAGLAEIPDRQALRAWDDAERACRSAAWHEVAAR